MERKTGRGEKKIGESERRQREVREMKRREGVETERRGGRETGIVEKKTEGEERNGKEVKM